MRGLLSASTLMDIFSLSLHTVGGRDIAIFPYKKANFTVLGLHSGDLI